MQQFNQASMNQNSFNEKIAGLLNKYPVILQFLKFAGIGFLTTAVDFLVLNLISKSLNINIGFRLGGINAISFLIALVHSYVWNGNWTFGIADGISALKSFFRIAFVGAIGVIGISLAVVGGKVQAQPGYYLIILGALAIVEIVVWKGFHLSWFKQQQNREANTLGAFVLVCLIGALINSGLVVLITQYWALTDNLDLNKNIAKVIATAISLFWNFFGCKLLVFKK